MNGVQEAGIQIVCLGERRNALADFLDLGLAGVDHLLDLFPGDSVFFLLQHFRHRPRGQFLAHLIGLPGEILMIEEDDEADRHQEIEDADDGIAPGGQEGGHLLFVSGFGGAGDPVSQPGAPMDNGAEGHGDDHGEDVEIPEFRHIQGIEEAFPRGPILHHGNNLLGPGEFAEDKEGEADQEGIENHALDGVGDHQGHGSAQADEGDGQGQEEDHQRFKGRQGDPQEGEALRKIQHPHEESGGDGGHDHVGHHLRQGTQGRGKNPEGTTVPHLQKLSQAHGLGLPKTVGHKARQGKHEAQRRQHRPPISQGKPRPVFDLHIGHQPDHGQGIGHLPHVQDIPPANPATHQKVRHSPHITTGVKSHEEHKDDRHNQNRPVP